MWDRIVDEALSAQTAWRVASYFVIFLIIEWARRRWPTKKTQLTERHKEKLRFKLATDIIRLGNKWERKHKDMDDGEVLFVLTALTIGLHKRIKTRQDFEAVMGLMWEDIKVERVE